MTSLVAVVGGLAIIFGFVVLRGAPYVPTHKKQLGRAFSTLYPLTDADLLVDLGAGDGVVLAEASRRGARAIGYELNPLLVILMKLRFLRQKNINVRLQDYLLLEQLPVDTTVVYVFATGRDIKRVHKKMIQWAVDTPLMLVTYGFAIPDKEPIQTLAPFELYHYEPQTLQRKAL